MPEAPAVVIRATCAPGEIRAAAMRDGTLLDYAIERPGRPDGVGDRHRARVAAVVPALAGAFLVLAGDEEAFLPDSQGGAGRVVGEAVTVVVTRAALGGKGKRVSARTEDAGPGPPALLSRGPGAIARLLALHPDATVVTDAPLAWRGATLQPDAWDDATATAVEALGSLAVPLPGGARATVHPTPALIAIDVDTAAATARGTKPAAINRTALPALAAAIRCRNLSGAIVVDLAGMAIRKRAALAPAFAEALATDPLQPRFLGFTALGLAEILRPRIHPALHELLAGPHAAGLAALRSLARESHADPARPRVLHAAPDVLAALDADSVARTDLANRTGRPLVTQAEPGLTPGTWRIEHG